MSSGTVSPITRSTFDASKIVFSEPKKYEKFSRVEISYIGDNGEIGPLRIWSPECFTYGVQQNDLSATLAYSMGMVLGKRADDGPNSDEEDEFIELLDIVWDALKVHVIENKDEWGIFNVEMSDLRGPLYKFKKEKGKPVPGAPPTLYPKIKTRGKDDEFTIITEFEDTSGRLITDPATECAGFGYAMATIEFHSFYIPSSSKIYPQIKADECVYRPLQSGRKRTARPSGLVPRVEMGYDAREKPPAVSNDSDADGEDDSDAVSEEPEPEPEKPKKKRRVVRKGAK